MEQYGDWFLEINPLHQIPVLIDGDFTLTESRAIGCYLANLQPECSLYPKDPRKRAVVDQMLYLDATYVLPNWYTNAIVSLDLSKSWNSWWVRFGLKVPIIEGTGLCISTEDREKIQKMMAHLESILKKSPYFCGEEMTLADLSILGSIAFFIVSRLTLFTWFILKSFSYFQHLKVDFKDYPSILKWFESLKILKGFNEADEGTRNFAEMFENIWRTNWSIQT